MFTSHRTPAFCTGLSKHLCIQIQILKYTLALFSAFPLTTALNHQGTNKKEGAQDRYLNHHIWDRAQVQRGAWEATQVKKTPCTQQTRVQTQEGRNELPRTYKNKRERQRYTGTRLFCYHDSFHRQAKAYNPSNWEVEAGGLGVQGHTEPLRVLGQTGPSHGLALQLRAWA